MNTAPLPLLFREALSAAGMPAIDEWWSQLDALARSEALHLWADCRQTESTLALRVETEFEDETAEGSGDFWHSDYYEYLVNHEVYLFEVPGIHICTQHPVARAAGRSGVIPHDFSCPFASAECPMRKLLGGAGGQSVKLRLTLIRTDKNPG